MDYKTLETKIFQYRIKLECLLLPVTSTLV
jgi:hypothetical protein